MKTKLHETTKLLVLLLAIVALGGCSFFLHTKIVPERGQTNVPDATRTDDSGPS